jgi:S1-C subfamily serine protease
MTSLLTLSNDMADSVAHAASSVVQVYGRRRPASGVVYIQGLIVTSARALGRDDGLQVRTEDGQAHDADLAGWDPGTGLAVLRAPSVTAPALARATATARVGHLALALARSWSNALTASAGIVAVIGGPLRTGRGRAIERVIRTTAPMHEGFAGGAFVDVTGALVGIATAAEIRGLGVVIPADIALTVAASLAEHGSTRRGYLGLAGQPVRLTDRQRGTENETRTHALLVVAVSEGGPADAAGLLVGDMLVAFDGHPVQSPMDLLELLHGHTAGDPVVVRVLRGGVTHDITVTIGERNAPGPNS